MTDRTHEEEDMTTVKLVVPPDQTPEEEAQLVADIAAAIADSTGTDTVHFEFEESEDVKYQALHQRTHASDRWNR